MRRNLDSRFDSDLRAFRILHRAMFAAILLIWLAVILGAGYLLFHPEMIGSFAGRIIAGFRAAA